MGSKRRISKHILPIILKKRKPLQWYVEPFVGGANMIDKVKGPRIGFDKNPYLISLLREIREGWVPFDELPEDEYQRVKKNNKAYKPHIVGYIGICCSFGAKWFGGYCRSHKEKRNYIEEAKRNVLNQAPSLKGCLFNCRHYNEIEFPGKNCLIYCDPTYRGTTKYKDDFNHEEFWEWCRIKTKEGHSVFISEYEAPEDFICVWEKEQTTTVNNGEYKKAIEKLFVIKPSGGLNPKQSTHRSEHVRRS